MRRLFPSRILSTNARCGDAHSILAFERQRQVDDLCESKTNLVYIEFQDNQGYIERSPVSKTQNNKKIIFVLILPNPCS